MDTEKLRELEREMRVEASHSDEKDADELNAWADRLRDILAAQPPKAEVPNGKLVGWWNGITPGHDGLGIPSIRWGADAENSGHDIPLYDGYNPIHYVTPPSSPAHTSEARDALLKELKWRMGDIREMLMSRGIGDQRIYGCDEWSTPTVNLAKAIDLIDAAMRQEGGSRE